MNDRQFFDIMRERARAVAREVDFALSDSGASDKAMAPHVARERIVKLRNLARHITALCDYVEAQP